MIKKVISFLILGSMCINNVYTMPATESESSFRRGEVLFFLSTPFTLLFSTILVGSVYTQVNQKDFTPSKWPQEVWLGVGALSMVSSGFVVYYDYIEMERKKVSDFSIRFRFYQNF